MDYSLKRRRIFSELREIGAENSFEVVDDNGNAVLIQSRQRIEGGSCLISLQLDESAFNPVYMTLGQLNDRYKKDEMLELLNSFNEENKLIKFYLDNENFIMAQTVYVSNDFQANEYISLMLLVFRLIEENYYRKIMKVIWS